MQDTKTLLKMKGVSKAFAAVQALDNVDFSLLKGQTHALVGENGAGKSTLVKILTGVERKDTGRIEINGDSVEIKNAHHARGLGIAAIFQELSLIPSLSVAENVLLANESVKSGFLLDRSAMVAKTKAILEKYDIDLDPEAPVSILSAAHRQLTEIIKAVSLKPQILVMDEPTSALSDKEAEIVFRIIDDFKKGGAGIIYVSHRMDEIFRIADRVTVLRDGNLIEDCDTKQLDLQKVVKLMVGREVQLYESTSKKIQPEEAKPRLQVENLTRRGLFTDISFELYEGEILGIAGLVGAGRSELVQAIFGVDKKDSGRIIIDGKPVKISCVRDALNLGIALLPESRHSQGLVLKHSVERNMTLPILQRFSTMGLVNYNKAGQLVAEKIKQLDIRPGDPKKIINFLSGGNQQKAVIAKWLLTEPKILIVDEPTAGVDVHAKAEIHRLLRELAEQGVSVIMISSEMPELLAHSDRVMVMNKGRVLGTFCDASQEQIMSVIMQDIMKNKAVCAN